MNVSTQKTAVIALIGPPNAGKSTLMNALVGEKVSIVSAKVQTTRTRIRGILSQDEYQLIFIDTPGLFDSKKPLEQAIVQAARETLGDADEFCVVLDASAGRVREHAHYVITQLPPQLSSVVLVLNKVDQVNKEDLLSLSKELNDLYSFRATYMISAQKGSGIQDLINDFKDRAPAGPWLYEEDQLSDLNDRLMAAEITREHLFHRLHQELPYQLTVETEAWENFDNGDIKIHQIIYVARQNHKGIILGKQGHTLKQISMAARREMEELLDQRVHLKLFIKVKENWMSDPERYHLWGLSV
jgi:GTP-binding protein Era